MLWKNNITFSLFLYAVSPKAKASCSESGERFSCLCEGIGGNPPSWASWVKDNTIIKGPEYLTSTVVKDDIQKGGEGIYYCEALSGIIKDVVRISLCKHRIFYYNSIASFELYYFLFLCAWRNYAIWMSGKVWKNENIILFTPRAEQKRPCEFQNSSPIHFDACNKKNLVYPKAYFVIMIAIYDK